VSNQAIHYTTYCNAHLRPLNYNHQFACAAKAAVGQAGTPSKIQSACGGAQSQLEARERQEGVPHAPVTVDVHAKNKHTVMHQQQYAMPD